MAVRIEDGVVQPALHVLEGLGVDVVLQRFGGGVKVGHPVAFDLVQVALDDAMTAHQGSGGIDSLAGRPQRPASALQQALRAQAPHRAPHGSSRGRQTLAEHPDVRLAAELPIEDHHRAQHVLVQGGPLLPAARAGAGEEHALLLPSRQRPDGPVLESGERDGLQRVPDPLPIPGARPPPQTPERVPSHAGHLGHRGGVAPVDVRTLGNVGDSVTVAANRVAEQGDGPPVDRDQSEHRLDQGGLPGAVGADDRAHAPGVKGPAGVVEHPLAAVGDPQAVDPKAGAGTHVDRPLRRPSAAARVFARIMPR